VFFFPSCVARILPRALECERLHSGSCILCTVLALLTCHGFLPASASAQLRPSALSEVQTVADPGPSSRFRASAIGPSSRASFTSGQRGVLRTASVLPESGEPALQTDADRWIPSWQNVRSDVLSMVRAPLTLDRDQTLQLVGASGLVVGVMAGLDRPAARRVPADADTHLATLATPASAPGRLYDRIGPDRFVLGAIGTFAVTGIALQEKQFTRTSFNLVEALALTKVTTGLFKGLAGRSRPYANASPWDINAAKFGSAHATKSMPSGHTSRAFAIASVIAHDYDRWWVQVPAYGVATSVGVQRIRSGNHWLSDVVLGGALGYLIGRTVADTDDTKDGSVSYDPIVGTNQLGLRVRF